MDKKSKIWLSPPHMSGDEQKYIKQAFDANWVAPIGHNVSGFEKDLENYLLSGSNVTVLSSGTAAIHLALKLLGVKREDEVLCQSFTFCASANPIEYLAAKPVFIDSERETWNMSPVLLEKAITDRISKGIKPKAIIVVDLYGMPYKISEISEISNKYNIPIIEDSAEALGSSYKGMKCGNFGDIGIFSFNGNKIITTSTGGALISKNKSISERAVYLATQARDYAPHYQHSEIGFNYRMSNILAGIGRGQMEVIEDRVLKRREIYEYYKTELKEYLSISFLDEPEGFYSNRWLTCIYANSFKTREGIRLSLAAENIEARPLWKPLHKQPIYENCLKFVDGTSEDLFNRGLCLPSGSNLSKENLDRIIKTIIKSLL